MFNKFAGYRRWSLKVVRAVEPVLPSLEAETILRAPSATVGSSAKLLQALPRTPERYLPTLHEPSPSRQGRNGANGQAWDNRLIQHPETAVRSVPRERSRDEGTLVEHFQDTACFPFESLLLEVLIRHWRGRSRSSPRDTPSARLVCTSAPLGTPSNLRSTGFADPNAEDRHPRLSEVAGWQSGGMLSSRGISEAIKLKRAIRRSPGCCDPPAQLRSRSLRINHRFGMR